MSVTCDGAQTNKAAWKECSINGVPDKEDKISCLINNPTAAKPKERIWFFQGVPEIF